MQHGNGYMAHGGNISMQHPQHAQHIAAHHHQQQQFHHQQQHHHQMQLPQQTQTSSITEPPSPLKQPPAVQIRPKYVEEQEKIKGGTILQQKEYSKLRESYLKQRFALIVMQRQLHVSNSRLNCALEGLKLAKESKPFHKYYVQAMDEKRHIKSVPKQKPEAKEEEEIQGMGGSRSKKGSKGATPTKMVSTKKGERQRPFKYSTRSKDEMTVISCAADYVVAGTATLREAKDALREMGIFDFETSLSNKMYNHPDKKFYLKMRKEKREEKRNETSKKTEARLLRKKSKEREHELKEQRKRQKRHKKAQFPQQQVPIIQDVQPGPHLTYGHPTHLQPPVPQLHYAHHDMHRL